MSMLIIAYKRQKKKNIYVCQILFWCFQADVTLIHFKMSNI